MTLTIYGTLRSSAFRVVWAAEELELDYKLEEIAVADCASDERLAARNPNRKIPVIDDDGVVLWESMAITLYLAAKSGGPLAPRTPVEAAQMQMWSFWVTNECLPDCITVLRHRMMLPEAERSEPAVGGAVAKLQPPLGILDGHLGKEAFLVGGRFTIADLNVASVVGWLAAARCDLSAFPHLSDWLATCSTRPAAARCTAMAAHS